MGRGNITFMPELMRRFGKENVAKTIETEISYWAKYWCEEPPFPFGSELFFDNTGYESVYFYRQYAKQKELAKQIVDVTKAGRGRAPCWFWNDSDQRWWDAVRTAPQYENFTDFGENCHHYMTGLNGWMLLEAYDSGYNRDEPGPIGYSGILNSWARVQPDGFAGMCYCPDPASDNYGLNQFTGDVGLGLWGNLKAARCYALDDPVIGLVAYGGQLDRSGNDAGSSFKLHPYPGLDHRIRCMNSELMIDSEGPAIKTVEWTKSFDTLSFELSNPMEYSCHASIKISGLPEGEYEWSRISVKPKKATGKKLVTISGAEMVLEADFSKSCDENWSLKHKEK
jgi:hypothetical protein